MVKHVEPHRLSGLQVGKSGISGGTGKGVVCEKRLHIIIVNEKEGMCIRSRDDVHILCTVYDANIDTVSPPCTHSSTGISRHVT